MHFKKVSPKLSFYVPGIATLLKVFVELLSTSHIFASLIVAAVSKVKKYASAGKADDKS